MFIRTCYCHCTTMFIRMYFPTRFICVNSSKYPGSIIFGADIFYYDFTGLFVVFIYFNPFPFSTMAENMMNTTITVDFSNM